MPNIVPEDHATPWDSLYTPAPFEPGSMATATPLREAVSIGATRTRALKNRVDRENGDLGIQRVRFVSSLGPLRALTPVATGDLCMVVPSAVHGGWRLFVYNAANLDATDDDFIVRPDAVASDAVAGRWVDIMRNRLADDMSQWELFALKVIGAAVFNNTATFRDPVTCEDAVECQNGLSLTTAGGLSCLRPAQFSGPTTLNGTTYLNGQMICQGTGRMRVRTYVLSVDDVVTVGINDGTSFRLPAGVFTGNKSIKISTAGAGEGDVIEIWTEDPTYLLVVSDTLGNNMLPSGLRYHSGYPFSVVLHYSGSAWRFKAWSIIPA